MTHFGGPHSYLGPMAKLNIVTVATQGHSRPSLAKKMTNHPQRACLGSRDPFCMRNYGISLLPQHVV